MTTVKNRACHLAIALLALLCLSACGDEKAERAGASKAPAESAAMDAAPKAPAQAESGGMPQEAAAGQSEPKPAPEKQEEAVAEAAGAESAGKKQEADEAARSEKMPEQTPGEATGETMKENSAKGGVPDEKDLTHRRFELQAINGAPYDFKEKRPSLEFNEGFQLAGAVCNGFMGKAGLENGVLSAKNMAATKKLCFEEGINRLEGDFFALMGNGAAIEFDGRRLILKGKGLEDDIVLEYVISDWVK